MKKVGLVQIALIFFFVSFPAFANPYDGNWRFKIKTLVGNNCSASAGAIVVSGKKFKGTIKSEGLKLRVSGKISDDGAIKGKVGGGLATLKGKIISASTGGGTWRNRFGCRGTFSFSR